ncbi:malonate decarboxylase, alpha subunit [Ancylobacter novellus DSM 506]|uniref:Malonate decarboxylase, alpha subunit n=1 Tax=Ancylobacter novellus (strain ATCC 8093 / DSM 506 / JCM 20403 / CCM 1077 / IAM 12100 / NBRC 12443 / NCIMB 10456) TaxID=639283 RepID=D7A7S5_ANCN5|nr:malonate decarboxylase subunit alpha [Ancylobacter novellus]ADH88523.1 malonate decarboxylase, alpha subunit [Ancylobacter novellus DSM 506]
MSNRSGSPTQRTWDRTRQSREARLAAASAYARGKLVAADNVTKLLEAVVRPGDRVCLEGDNQKQADFLAASLAAVDPKIVNDLHIVQSGVVLAEHLDLFEAGVAKRLDFSYSGPQGGAIARALKAGKIELGAVHTYLELFSRYFVDLTPHVALTVARCADRDGNLYMGPNTEDSPVVVEATAFKQGIVIAQVNELVDRVPRVDVPGDRVDFVIVAPEPFYIEPLFTRDPAQITETQILGAMLAIKGIYAPYGVKRLNHGIGFNTAAIELILPTFAERLGLKGKIATHFALNPHPTLIPAIESGWVEQIHSFGSEVGMDDYMRARPDVFFTGRDGSMGSNRMYCQSAGLYATDLFIGSTLQIDLAGNSSTFTKDRVAGFGGAPNMGSDPHGRRHASDPWLQAGREAAGDTKALPRGRKLVVQIVETFGDKLSPTFVEELDSLALARSLDLPLPPVMIYGDDVSHIITEEGIANLLLCRTPLEREQAIRGIAGYTDVGRARDKRMVEELRARKVIQRPEDLGIDPLDANRSLLAARSIKELMHWSGNLYDPPAKFRNW